MVVVGVFQEIGPFNLCCEMCVCRFVHSIPLWNVQSLSEYLFHFWYWSFRSSLFFWPVLHKICQFFWSFQRTSPFFMIFSLLSFCFQLYWFLSSIISFLLPILVCFAFIFLGSWDESFWLFTRPPVTLILTFVKWSTGCWMASCGQRRTTEKLK